MKFMKMIQRYDVQLYSSAIMVLAITVLLIYVNILKCLHKLAYIYRYT